MQDIFDDIQEAMDTDTDHYIGTFVLTGGKGRRYDIVDGQQCLSALTLIIHALLAELKPKDSERLINEAILLYHNHDSKELKLDFGVNASFVKAMLEGKKKKPNHAYRIANIYRENFSEDDILRYHYLSYNYPGAENISDYYGYTRTVFDGFLKTTLKKVCCR